MKKRYIVSAAGALGAGMAGYFLKNEGNRGKMKKKYQAIKEKISNNEENSTLDEAGIPGQVGDNDVEQLENSKMVSEGSQFGVDYYNKVKEEQNNKN